MSIQTVLKLLEGHIISCEKSSVIWMKGQENSSIRRISWSNILVDHYIFLYHLFMRWLVRNLIFVFIIFVFPFVLLIRGSVLLHNSYGWYAWTSLLGGMVATALVLFIYFSFIYGRFTGKLGKVKSLKRRLYLSFIIVLAFCLHGLLFLSGNNFKRADLKKEFTQLHPILRMGISTLVHIDKSLVITDAARVPEDYKKMGLRTKSGSLHYKQKDGFVHAVDLRTNGRGEFRNMLLNLYFRIMGFRTLRHNEAGDHLHVSIKSHERPWAI